MRRISLRLIVPVLLFLVGVTMAGLWAVGHYRANKHEANQVECIPTYSQLPPGAGEKSWSSALARFREMPMDSLPICVEESYRLTWIPAFHSPVSVRVWHSQGKSFLVAKQLDGRGGSGMGQLGFEQTRELTEDEWFGFKRLLSQAGYWNMSSADTAPPPNDGAEWIIEGLQDRKIHDVHRRSPSREFRDACIHLVKLSGLKTEIERY